MMSPGQRRNIIQASHKIAKLEKNRRNLDVQWRAAARAGDMARINALSALSDELKHELFKILASRRHGLYKNAIREEVAARKLRSKFRKYASPLLRSFREKGLAKERARALANFKQFQRDPRGRTPSPKKRSPKNASRPATPRGPKPRSPATLTREARMGIVGGFKHAIASPNNTRITWRRSPSGRISILKTLENMRLNITNAQRNALLALPENKAREALRKLSRGNVI